MQTSCCAPVRLLMWAIVFLVFHPISLAAAKAKTHTVSLGAARKVPWSRPDKVPNPDDPASKVLPTLKVRPLIVDGKQKEWTTGDAHDVTDRSFTIRRAMRLNDTLPGDATPRWSWQPGPWLLIDRATGHITALHLPDFDQGISEAVWYRDYAAYCGTGTTAKGGLFVVVAQLGTRRPVVHKQIGKWPEPTPPDPVCKPAEWQRDPMRVTLQPAEGDAMTFAVVGAASLIEDEDSDDQ
ncbi:MAG TPA: hypothetical protein VHU44_10540 [Acidobacteriaceae bacterium]|nr:hypothetical protein [Acidobacteriaceae bacterium]